MPKIHTKLTKHVPQGKQSEDFKKYFINAVEIREVFLKLVEEELEALISTKEEDYSKGSWAYYQADKNGQIKVWKMVQKLMTIKDND